MRRLVALLIVGLLIAWLAPRWITGPAEKLLSQPLPSLALGLAGLIAAPITWLVALGVLIAIAVVFGLLSLGALTGLTLLAGLPVLGLAFVAVLFVGELPVPGDHRLPGWALDPQPHPAGMEPPDLRTAADWPAHPGPALRRAGRRRPAPGSDVLAGLGAIILAVLPQRPGA